MVQGVSPTTDHLGSHKIKDLCTVKEADSWVTRQPIEEERFHTVRDLCLKYAKYFEK